MVRWLGLVFISLLSSSMLLGQHSVNVNGRVMDEMQKPLPYANIVVEGQPQGASSDESGHFSFSVMTEDSLYLTISSLGYKDKQLGFSTKGERELEVNVVLELEVNQLPTATIEDKYARKSGLTRLNPKTL